MHTVRNRLAQSPRRGRKQAPPPTTRDDVAFLLRDAAPPRNFPADLVVPPHRGAVITASPWPLPAVPAPIEPAAGSARPPHAQQSQKAARKAARRAAAQARAHQHDAARCAGQIIPPSYPDNAETIPVRDAPECHQALSLPPDPAARVDRPAPAEVAHHPDVPLPSARALVPRRQGFIDVLAFALRDSGRRLARWSSARRRADDMKDKLARAEARMRALEAQLAALQAIRQRVRN